MTINLADVAGRIGRKTRLNDSVLVYALRQMAADYPDIHVFHSIETHRPLPELPLSGFRWVFFPVNYENVHWTLICAHVSKIGVDFVQLYDPLQDRGYEDLLATTWQTQCRPLLQKWIKRDQSVSVVSQDTEFVRLEAQHDTDSCGVYCVAVTYDRMSELYAFHDEKKVGMSASTQLRVRILWRILYDSTCVEPHESNYEVLSDLSTLEKHTALAKTKMRSTKRFNKKK